MSNYMRPIAVFFAFLYVIFFMLAPVVSINQIALYGYSSTESEIINGGVLMLICAWPILPAIFGVMMGIFAMKLLWDDGLMRLLSTTILPSGFRTAVAMEETPLIMTPSITACPPMLLLNFLLLFIFT